MKLSVIFLFALSVWAQPVIRNGGVVNAANLAGAGLPNHGVAQGARFAVLGSGLGPVEPLSREEFPLAAELGGASIKIDMAGSVTDALLVYASSTRLVAVLPSTTPVGKGRVTVSVAGQSASADIEVVPARFGIYTRSGSASGPARALNADDVENTPATPARPGERVAILGTGLGPVSGDEAAGPLAADLDTEIEVFVGALRANVVSKARTASAGVDRIAFEVPDGIAGCYAGIAVRIAGVVSNFASISISPEGKCSDPAGFTASDFERLQPGSSLSYGYISLSRTSLTFENFDITSHGASGSFVRYRAEDVFSSGGFGGFPSIGSCTVNTFVETEEIPVQITTLDAGPQLTITGPKGTRNMVRRQGVYSADLGQAIPGLPVSEAFLDPGEYTVAGPGGADVGPFSARITLGAPLVWTNRNSLASVSRAEDTTVSWTGGGSNDVVLIFGASGSERPRVSGSFFCLERASAGQFTIPAHVLSVLPPASQGLMQLSLSPATDGNRFTATGLDFGVISQASGSGRSVAYR